MSDVVIYAEACQKIGLDPKEVARIARAVERSIKRANDLGLYFFGGQGGCLRFDDDDRPEKGPLIIASFFLNTEGGDGAEEPDEEGLLRGEV